MLSYAKLQNKPRILQNLSGLTVSEFEKLLPSFEQAWHGKKKRTTVKNNLITERRRGGKVKYLSEPVEGKRHDTKLTDDEQYAFPEGSELWKDTGFQGYEPENVTTFQPKKKPRGKELTPEEKEENQKLSSERMIVEHHIGGVKRSRIVHDIFRNRKDNYSRHRNGNHLWIT
jgi:hypothetical protein